MPRRRATRLGSLVWVIAAASCASNAHTPHPTLAAIWRDYQTLPTHRALAIAGEPERRALWVAGASGGNATRDEAEARALNECRMRRERQRMQAACELYATGDEVVWRRRP